MSSTLRCTMALAFACALGQHQAECSAVLEWDLCGVWRVKLNGKPGVLVLDTGSNQTVVSSNLIIVKQLILRDIASTAKDSFTGRQDGQIEAGLVQDASASYTVSHGRLKS